MENYDNIKNRAVFETIDADALINKPMPKSRFLVEDLLPQGVNILCGASKIGKSWLMLDLALKIAKGEPLWGMETMKCDVLYLCLEDSYQRIQDRIMDLTDEAPKNLYFSNEAATLGKGLELEISNFLESHPQTKLIIIDTLQKIRAMKAGNAGGVYANDYEDMSVLKKISADRGVTILLVHHLRKQKDDEDVFNQLSGSTGIVGAADTAYVLTRDARESNTATLYATGRDITSKSLRLRFDDDLHWKLVKIESNEDTRKEQIPSFVFKIVDYLQEHNKWIGTATELLYAFDDTETSPASVTKMIVKYYYDVLFPAGIKFTQKRKNNARLLIFTKAVTNKECENGI